MINSLIYDSALNNDFISGILNSIYVDNTAGNENNIPNKWIFLLETAQGNIECSIETARLQQIIPKLGIPGLTLSSFNSNSGEKAFSADGDHYFSYRRGLTAVAKKGRTNTNGKIDVIDIYVNTAEEVIDTSEVKNSDVPIPEEWPEPEHYLPFNPVPVPMPKDPGFTRIGYAVFNNPINSVTQTRTSQIDQIPAMRLTGTIKKGTGKAYESYTISYVAHGPEEIEKSVKEVFEQISLTPFTSVDGGPFGPKNKEGDIKHKAIAVRNFSLSTIDGLPNAVQVEISFDPFNWQFYLPMSNREDEHNIASYDDSICWPLVKVWAKSAARSQYRGNDFNGRFGLYMPTDSGKDIIDAIYSQENNQEISSDYNALKSFSGMLHGQPGAVAISSRNIKEISQPGFRKNRIFILKLKDLSRYNEVLNSKFCVGLSVWDRLSANNFTDHLGNYLPKSTLINPLDFTSIARDRSFSFDESNIDRAEAEYLQHYCDVSKYPIETLPARMREALTAAKYNELTTVETLNNPQDLFALVISAGSADAYEELKNYISEATNRSESEDPGIKPSPDAQVLEALFNPSSSNPWWESIGEIGPTETILEIDGTSEDTPIIIERIGASRGHNLALLSPRGDPLPVHQYMGGMDATFIVQGKCFGLEAKRTLEGIKEDFDKRAILKKSSKISLDVNEAKKTSKSSASFMYVDNEIFALLGVNFVMPVTLSFESIDQQPGVWSFTFSFIEYSPLLKRAEEVKYLNTSFDKLGQVFDYGSWLLDGEYDPRSPILDKAKEYFQLQSELAREEIYPDLYLPTKAKLMFWISALKKGASLWNPSKGLSTLAPIKGKKSPGKLSEAEFQVVSIVANQFFGNSVKTIKQFQPDLMVTRPGEESTSYVEPDFYVWYHPEDGFGYAFDNLSKELMGNGPQKELDEKNNLIGKTKVTKKFDADGVSKDSNMSGFREHDPSSGLSRQWPAEYWSCNAAKYPLDEVIGAKAILYPEDRAKKHRELVEAAEKTMDEDPKAWWVKLLANMDSARKVGDKLYVLPLYDEQFSVFAAKPTVKNGGAISPSDKENSGYFQALQENLSDYFTIWWAQKMIGNVNATDYQLTPADMDDWINREPDTKFFAKNFWDLNTETNVLAIFYRIFNGTTIPDDYTIGDLETSIKRCQELFRESGSKITLERIAQNIGDTYYVPDFIDISTTTPWIVRSSLIAGNWSRIKNDQASLRAKTWTGKGMDGLIESWDTIDLLCSRTQYADPQIIRSILLARDNYGQFERIASPETGFSDFNIPADNLQGIQKIIDTYESFMDQLQVPSLALLAMNLELTHKAAKWRDDFGHIRKDVLADLKKQAYEVNKNIESEAASVVINSTLKKYSEGGYSVNSYYTSYLSVSRVFGALNSRRNELIYDNYFTPYNHAIPIDTETNEEKLIVLHNPAGTKSGVTIYLSRSEAKSVLDNPNLENLDGFDRNQSSLDIEERLVHKMQAAMDPHSEVGIYGSLIDFRTHAPFGKLRGAFPSFQVLIVNEGFYWGSGNKKLWDQFYTRTGIASIEVHKSRSQPGATAAVVFSNMFHNITSYALTEALAHKAALAVNKKMGNLAEDLLSPFSAGAAYWDAITSIWNAFLIKDVPEDVIKLWQNNHLKRLALTAGARLQIRMGYGSNAAKLPVVFVGNVVDAPVSDGYVTITAVSDGYELEKPITHKLNNIQSGYAFTDGGAGPMGADPSLMIKHAMISASFMDNLTGGNFRDHSQGVIHFGEVMFNGSLRYAPEVELNIYAARRTALESGISEIANYSIVNGIVNWENERNLFSISVQEPTTWKVMEVCRRACSDFVAAAEPFALRSTAFFGKWWWPYHFTYHESILDLENLTGYGLVSANVAYSTQSVGPEITTGAFEGANSEGKVGYGSNVKGPYLGKNTFIRESLPKDLVKVAEGIYSTAPVAYGTFLRETTWNIYFENQAMIQITNLVPDTINMIRPTAEQQAAYERAKNSKGGTYVEPFTGNIKQANPETASTKKIQEELKLPLDGLKDVTVLQSHLRWKPYMQAYIAHSMINLLENNIRADSSKVYTDAVGMHQYNGWISGDSVSKTIAYSVDTDIHPSDRKTMMVDTGIMLTGLQSGSESIAAGAAGILGKIPFLGDVTFGNLNRYIEESPTTPAIENAVVGALIDQVKEMYQGWFTIQGMGSVKPRDLFLLTDHILDLKGPVFVKDVVHRMDAQTGFVTLVSPDAVVLPHDSIIGLQYIQTLSVGILYRIGSFLVAKAVANGLFQVVKNRWIYNYETGELGKGIRRWARLKDSIEVDIPNDFAKWQQEAQKLIEEDLKKVSEQISDAKKGVKLPEGTTVEDLIDQIKELEKELKTIKSKQPSDLRKVIEIIKNRGIKVDLEAFEKLRAASSLKLRLQDFEIDLAKKVQEFRQLTDPTEAPFGLSDNFDAKELEKAIVHYQEEQRALFLTDFENARDAQIVLRNIKTAPQITAKIDKLKDISKRIEEARGLTDPDISLIKALEKDRNVITADLNQLIQAGNLVEEEIDDSTVRSILNFKKTIWVEGQNKHWLKAAFDGLTETPRALVRGTGKLGTSIVQEFFQAIEDKKRLAAKAGKTGKKIKAWLEPLPITKVRLWIADMHDEMNKSAQEAIDNGTIFKELAAHKEELDKIQDEAKRLERAKELYLEVNKAKKMKNLLEDVQKAAKAGINAVRLLKYSPPTALLSIIFDVLVYTLGNSFIEGHKARLRSRQCVKIVPLRIGDIPYTAGIKGHQGAVLGDDPGWTDILISNLHGVKTKNKPILPDGMITVLGFLAAANGVDVPDYGYTEIDTANIEVWREKRNGN